MDNACNFFNSINKKNEFVDKNLYNISPLNLAYLGDAIFEVLVRDKVLKDSKTSVNKLNSKAKSFVNAKAQCEMYYKIINFLSEEEYSIMKRGRNTKSISKAKNATIVEYRHATGLEALFGYLFLKGDNERINFIFEKCIINDEENNDEKK